MKFLHKLNYVLLILCLSCTTYANEVKEEKEIVDTEYQFTHEYMAKGENGYYLCIGSFLFYWEEGMDEATPLCSKIDCMHQYEEDREKARECEAYVGYTSMNLLDYYDRKLYTLGVDWEHGRSIIQYVMDADGTNREKNDEYKYYDYVSGWSPRYHKGYLYYATVEAEPLGEGYVNKVSKLWRKIADGSEEAEKLFETDYKAESKVAFDSGFVMPFYLYKDYAYFATMREDGCYQRYVYDLKEKKATALPYRYEDAVNMMVRGFYEDKMIYSYAFEHDDREEGKNVFISNLDGSEEELLFTAKPSFFFAGMDDKYVYLDDGQCEAIINGEKHTRTIYIYDKNTGELMWEYDMINPTILAWGLGDENYLFYLATGDTVYALDKKSLIPGQEPVTKLIVEAPNDIF